MQGYRIRRHGYQPTLSALSPPLCYGLKPTLLSFGRAVLVAVAAWRDGVATTPANDDGSDVNARRVEISGYVQLTLQTAT